MQILEDMSLELAVFELRYDHAFLLWDMVGSIWSSIITLNPSLKVTGVQANQQVFESPTVQITLDISQIKVESRGSNALEELSRNSSLVLDVVSSKLKMSAFKRSGLRVIYKREFASSEDARDFIGNPHSDHECALGSGAKQVGFSRSNKYETEKSGLQTAFKLEERELNFTVPWAAVPFFSVPTFKNQWAVIADADYYTVGIIDAESFDVETWIRHGWKTIRRDWSSEWQARQ